jgi:glutamate-1-semialdehyde aminotransferase
MTEVLRRTTTKNLALAKSATLYNEAIKLIPAGSPTLSKKPEYFAMGAFPMYIQRGQGCRVWDVDGNEYLDYIGSLGPITLGYCYPRVDDAIKEQLKNGTIFSLMHPLEVETAKAITDMVPCADMVRFVKTGAESTSAAVRIARAYTGKDLIVNWGYHGWLDTWRCEGLKDTVSANGLPGVMKSLIKSFMYGDTSSDSSLEAVLNRNKGNVACIIMEPLLYESTECCDFLQWARDLADEHDAVLIYDEIVTGFRIANGGAQEYSGVIPDIACFAKGISNGMPLAAVAGRREIMEATANAGISSTYGGETLSLAASVATLSEYREKDVIDHIWDLGSKLSVGMNSIANQYGLQLSVKGWPPMSMYEFQYEDDVVNEDLMTLFLQEMAKQGILFRRGGLIMMTYSHQEEDISFTLDKCREVFPILADAYAGNSISELLQAGKAQAGFRKF